ncbi:hypothetical protein [Bacillus altitudinis]|uniref:hypothetical protein n=1 Tax=Bacillus altitudinis TaxID=293387 RepID=UPI001F492965|nr:hypothetical protein [Bacillus altitudinis]
MYFYDDAEAIFAENGLGDVFLRDDMNWKGLYEFYELSGGFNSGFVGCGKRDVAKGGVREWKEKWIA